MEMNRYMPASPPLTDTHCQVELVINFCVDQTLMVANVVR